MEMGGLKVYTRGKSNFIDNCNSDRFSFWEVDEVRSTLGYRDLVEFWYRVPGSLDDEGLVQIISDKEVVSMLEVIPQFERVI